MSQKWNYRYDTHKTIERVTTDPTIIEVSDKSKCKGGVSTVHEHPCHVETKL